MTGYLIRRLFQGVLILFIVTVLVFAVMRLLPGDPLSLYVSQKDIQEITPEQLEELHHQFGLDKPLPMQYISWINGVLHGDLGISIYYNQQRVSYLISSRLPVTFHLGVIAFAISTVLGILFGIICALRRGSWIDNVVTFVANIGITVPTFWVGILLIYIFAMQLKWLPTTGYTSPFLDFGKGTKQLIMPVFCLAIPSISGLTRQTRSSMLEVVMQDYVRTAWAKGLREKTIVLRHEVKNALIPVVTMLGMQVGMVFGGSVLIETVFNIPGMGRLLTQAVFGHDFQVVQAGTLMVAGIVVLSNLIVDISYVWFDPRIRYG
jgi:peptide/nickel transport system permease protein